MKPALKLKWNLGFAIPLLINLILLSCANNSNIAPSSQKKTKTKDSVSLVRPTTQQGIRQMIASFYEAREKTAPPAIKAKLDALRKEIAQKNYGFEVGYTSVLDRPIRELTGEIEPTLQVKQGIKAELDNEDKKNSQLEGGGNSQGYITINGTTLFPQMTQLDLRQYGLVTPVKDQNPASSCWAFGAMAAYESNYLVQHSRGIQASKQYVINCSGAGTAKTGA